MKQLINPEYGGVLTTRFFIGGKMVPGEEILANSASVLDGRILLFSGQSQVMTDGELRFQIPANAISKTERTLHAVFEITTAETRLEKYVEFVAGKNQFDINAFHSDLITLCPEIIDYPWEEDPQFSRQREIALNELHLKLSGSGRIDQSREQMQSLVLPFLYLWLAHIFRNLSKTPEDGFSYKQEEYFSKYQELFREINFDIGAEISSAKRTRLRRG